VTTAVSKRTELRDYQWDAVEKIVSMLPDTVRGTVVMACGSGKTAVAACAAELLSGSSGDTTLVMAPSLALLDQLSHTWAALRDDTYDTLAVCSDDEIGASPDEGGPLDDNDLPTATTDPKILAEFLTRKSEHSKVVFATYQSSPVVSAGTQRAEHTWTLAVCDEAHRTAGTVGARFTTVLSDAKVPCEMRLFMTASPRIHTTAATVDGRELVSMDNEKIYGPRLYTYTFRDGIEDGWLSDYRILVLLVNSPEVFRAAYRGQGIDVDGREISSSRAAAITGLLSAANEHDLRRVITFHNTITASRNFDSDLRYLSSRPEVTGPKVSSYHLDGLATPGQRRGAIDALAHPPEDARVIVNNVRVLGEGVDIPALDAIMFAEPKSSQIDVIQAVGRAIRLNPDRDAPSLIVVPVLLADGESPQAVLDGSTFKHVWQVVNALRDHDESLDDELNEIRRNAYDPNRPAYEPQALPDRIVVSGVSITSSKLSDAVKTVILDHATTTWSYGFDIFVGYTEKTGSADVSVKFVDETTGFPLGSWVQAQRQAYRWGRLTRKQVSQLESVEFAWGTRSGQWRKNITLVETLCTLTGMTMTTTDLAVLAPSLAPWFRTLLRRRDSKRLSTGEKRELSELFAWGNDPVSEVMRIDDLDELAEDILKSGRLPKAVIATGSKKRIPRETIHEILSLLSRHGMLTPEHREKIASAEISLSPLEPDINIGSRGWVGEATLRLARFGSRAHSLLRTGQSDKPGKPNKSSVKRKRVAEPPNIKLSTTSKSSGEVDLVAYHPVLNRLMSHRSDTTNRLQRIRMRDDPVTVSGVSGVRRRVSDLVTDLEEETGTSGQYLVLTNNRVLQRANEESEWVLSGELNDHLQTIVYTIGSMEEADFDDEKEVLRLPALTNPEKSESSEDTLDVHVPGGAMVPKAVIDEMVDTVIQKVVPRLPEIMEHLVKSYGVRRVRGFETENETRAYITKARRRGERVARISSEMIDDVNHVSFVHWKRAIQDVTALAAEELAEVSRAIGYTRTPENAANEDDSA
jgi:superfamily II DNA or RNA helicase